MPDWFEIGGSYPSCEKILVRGELLAPAGAVAVITDGATIQGNGTPASPLSTVPGGIAVVTDGVTVIGDGTTAAPLVAASSSGMTFGTGLDGALVFDGISNVTLYGGVNIVPVAGVYTLPRTILPSSIVIDASVVVDTANCQVICKGTITGPTVGTATFRANGNNGGNAVLAVVGAGGALRAAGVYIASIAGQQGGSLVVPGTSATCPVWMAAGAGIAQRLTTVQNAGSSNGVGRGATGGCGGLANGANGTSVGATSTATAQGITSGAYESQTGLWNGRGAAGTQYTYGTSGGGGSSGLASGGGGTAGAGGGGGGSASPCLVAARRITGNVVVESNGGNGGNGSNASGAPIVNAAASGGGGGGGGAGGPCIVIIAEGSFPGMTANGGAAGTGGTSLLGGGTATATDGFAGGVGGAGYLVALRSV